uniref:Uncharacterized protein n=1 Tax=Plectus sambesii TaxID=2011161 RepID=A0A914W9R0_9BILA
MRLRIDSDGRFVRVAQTAGLIARGDGFCAVTRLREGRGDARSDQGRSSAPDKISFSPRAAFILCHCPLITECDCVARDDGRTRPAETRNGRLRSAHGKGESLSSLFSPAVPSVARPRPANSSTSNASSRRSRRQSVHSLGSRAAPGQRWENLPPFRADRLSHRCPVAFRRPSRARRFVRSHNLQVQPAAIIALPSLYLSLSLPTTTTA